MYPPIGKQADFQGKKIWITHPQTRPEGRPGRRIVPEPVRLRQQVTFAQQPPAAWVETGEKKLLDQRQARVRAAQPMTVQGPVLGAQVVQVDPARRRRLAGQQGQQRLGQPTAKAFHQPVHGSGVFVQEKVHQPGVIGGPVLPVQARQRPGIPGHPLHGGPVIHPEHDRMAMFLHQLSGQPPAHAQIAIIVHHLAKNMGVWHTQALKRRAASVAERKTLELASRFD